jgi:hypothetical protein
MPEVGGSQRPRCVEADHLARDRFDALDRPGTDDCYGDVALAQRWGGSHQWGEPLHSAD